MNWEAAGAIGEIVGAAAVVATLIYFGLQMRQSARVARAESERELIQTWHDASVAFVREGERLLKVLDGFEGLEEDDVHYCLTHLNDVVMAHFSIWRMYELHQLDNAQMETYNRMICYILSTKSGAAWWQAGKFSWGHEEYIDGLLAEHDGTSWIDWNRNFIKSIKNDA